jgi:REP element-mobilizing transposase RayT
VNRPLAYFLTWTTYGTWLHGDVRGSFDANGNYVLPNEAFRELDRTLMTAESVILSLEQRAIVDNVIVEHCRIRKWVLHARNARTMHVHVVLSANVDGETAREQLKAWASRRLSEHAGLPRATDPEGGKKWWTQKGNIEEIWEVRHLESAIRYVEDQ